MSIGQSRGAAVIAPSARRGRVVLLTLLSALLSTMLLTGVAAPAFAVEEAPEGQEEPPPDIEELCREGTVGGEFCPETYEEPSWFQWVIYPLLIIGVVMVAVLLVAYLTWHPRFARERAERLKSRR